MCERQSIRLKKLNKEIEDLRGVLNKIVDKKESSTQEILEISIKLDKLINEYYKF